MSTAREFNRDHCLMPNMRLQHGPMLLEVLRVCASEVVHLDLDCPPIMKTEPELCKQTNMSDESLPLTCPHSIIRPSWLPSHLLHKLCLSGEHSLVRSLQWGEKGKRGKRQVRHSQEPEAHAAPFLAEFGIRTSTAAARKASTAPLAKAAGSACKQRKRPNSKAPT